MIQIHEAAQFGVSTVAGVERAGWQRVWGAPKSPFQIQKFWKAGNSNWGPFFAFLE
jgi:hypothetical protein